MGWGTHSQVELFLVCKLQEPYPFRHCCGRQGCAGRWEGPTRSPQYAVEVSSISEVCCICELCECATIESTALVFFLPGHSNAI